jgi:hypothetical protein
MGESGNTRSIWSATPQADFKQQPLQASQLNNMQCYA